MGVADNKTYKDQYHFNDNYFIKSTEVPSVNKDPKVNDTIKENPYRSNVEIEGKEIVLKPDLSALFKAVGKRHSQGGMNVLLEPDSFIFSDDKELAFDENDHELMELKKGGNFKPTNNTPADVLKRNIDPKHYNTMMTILNDPKKDKISKDTAMMMLQKYMGTLGNIAYMQEAKKGFPQGLPSFSEGTAPVYDPKLKSEIDENKQYMKYGGTIANPYKMQSGGRFRKVNNKDGSYTIFGEDGSYQTFFPNGRVKDTKADGSFDMRNVQNDDISDVGYQGKNINYTTRSGEKVTLFENGRVGKQDTKGNVTMGTYSNGQTSWDGSTPTSNSQKQQTPSGKRQDRYIGKLPPYPSAFTNYYDKTEKKQYNAPDWINPEQFYSTPGLIDYMKTLNDQKGIDNDLNKPDDATWGWRHQAALDKFYPNGNKVTLPPFPMADAPIPSQFEYTVPKKDDNIPVPGIEGNPQGVKRADWQFTPWQKLSLMHNLSGYANTKRYMPYRSQEKPSYMDPALVNPEQNIADMKGAANSQTSSLNSLNPIMRNAQAASIYGTLLNQMPGIRNQYDNQNAQILNSTRQYNNQIRNKADAQNTAYDQQYYKESVIGKQNYDNMKQFMSDRFMNELNSDVQQNQSLAYQMLTQNNPAYNYDWKTGNFTRTNKSIMDVNSRTGQDIFQSMIGQIKDLHDQGIPDSVLNSIIRGRFLQQAAPYFQQPNQNLMGMPYYGTQTGRTQKKGGIYNPYKK